MERARKIQMVFQDPYSSLNPRQTVAQAIIEPLRVHGLYDAKRCEEVAVELLVKVGCHLMLPCGCRTNFLADSANVCASLGLWH